MASVAVKAGTPRAQVPRAAKPRVSKARVHYEQPSGVKAELMPLYIAAGKRLDIPPALVRAVAIVESQEKPLTKGGKPVTRFEKGYWTAHRLATRQAIAFDTAVNSADLDTRWAQFEAMRAVNGEAAIKAHSWGMFQIMGVHHERCGYASLDLFVKNMHDPAQQVAAFVHFCQRVAPILSALRRGDAQALARHYNGSQYARNLWDVKFAAAARAGGDDVWAV